MIILQTMKWLAIATGVAVAALPVLLAIAVWALLVLADHWRYKLSRHRTLKAVEKLRALKAKFASAISIPSLSNPLMRGFSIPLSRFEKALFVLEERVAALEHANDMRHGPHARSEWKYLRRDVNRVFSRGKQLEYFLEAPDARDGVWPFVEDHSAIYAAQNYSGREPKRMGVFDSPSDNSFGRAHATAAMRMPQRPQRERRNFGIGRGVLDEDVMPSLEERRQAQMAALAEQPGVTVLKPALKSQIAVGVYDKTGKVVPFRRPHKIDVKA
jgi:hypothetical protein